MDRDRHLELVRILTRHCLEIACPEKLADFTEDFAAFAVTAAPCRVDEGGIVFAPPPAPPPPPSPSGLDTTLVAGMFFNVLVEAEKLPARPPERVAFIRKEAKNYLVTRLAGQISLSQFFRLLNLIEQSVQRYFEHLEGGWLARPSAVPTQVAPVDSEERIQGEALRQALAQITLLPKGRRKITHETLWEFFRDTRSDWFRLLDFEEHFRINKKTAWAYLNLLHKAGILEHNKEKANKVRYILAAPFRRSGSPPPNGPSSRQQPPSNG